MCENHHFLRWGLVDLVSFLLTQLFSPFGFIASFALLTLQVGVVAVEHLLTTTGELLLAIHPALTDGGGVGALLLQAGT